MESGHLLSLDVSAILNMMDFTLASETLQVLELVGNAAGIALALIVFAIGLGAIGAKFISTQLP